MKHKHFINLSRDGLVFAISSPTLFLFATLVKVRAFIYNEFEKETLDVSNQPL